MNKNYLLIGIKESANKPDALHLSLITGEYNEKGLVPEKVIFAQSTTDFSDQGIGEITENLLEKEESRKNLEEYSFLNGHRLSSCKSKPLEAKIVDDAIVEKINAVVGRVADSVLT